MKINGMEVKESDIPTPFDGKVRRFAVIEKDVIHFVEPDEDRPYVWCFSRLGWSERSTLLGAITEKGVLTWVGVDHREVSWMVSGDLAPHADLLGVPPETPVWSGLDKDWNPVKQVTTVGALLAERRVIETEVRLRPETLERIEKALGGRAAVQKLIRRAIGTGAEERIVKLFEDECRPHDGEHVRGGPDSNELMRCRRCGAEWWD